MTNRGKRGQSTRRAGSKKATKSTTAKKLNKKQEKELRKTQISPVVMIRLFDNSQMLNVIRQMEELLNSLSKETPSGLPNTTSNNKKNFNIKNRIKDDYKGTL